MSIVAPTAHVRDAMFAIVATTVKLPMSMTDVVAAFVTYAFAPSGLKTTPCGFVPVATVATAVFDAASMMVTFPDSLFVTIAHWLLGDTITSQAKVPTETLVTTNVVRSMMETSLDKRLVT